MSQVPLNSQKPIGKELKICWDLGLRTISQAPSPSKMPTWQHFLEVLVLAKEVVFGTCIESSQNGNLT